MPLPLEIILKIIICINIIRPVVVHGLLAGDGSLAFLLAVGIGRHAGGLAENLVESLGGLVAA